MSPADGPRIDSFAIVSISWNSNKAYPRGGYYGFDLGSNPRQAITVYVDGETCTVVDVDGDSRHSAIMGCAGAVCVCRVLRQRRFLMNEQWRSRITIEPGKRSGQPCIRGMRITVHDVRSTLPEA